VVLDLEVLEASVTGEATGAEAVATGAVATGAVATGAVATGAKLGTAIGAEVSRLTVALGPSTKLDVEEVCRSFRLFE
jgi:hypothetical protein